MSSHRVRKRQAAYSKMSKKPGLVSTLGRSMFVRRIIRNRTNCGNGCNPEILGVLVAVLVNNSPIEIPLTFNEPITVNWDDENNPGKVTYQPGDRVFHNYQKRDAGGNLVDADPRERTITVTYKDNVEFDYSEDQGSYLQTHAAEIEADAKYTFAPKVGDNLTGKDGTQYYVSKMGAGATELQLSTSSFPIKKVVDAAFEFNADSDIKKGKGTPGLASGNKIFDTTADAIDFGAGDKNLWVYTTKNDKKDGILDDAGTTNIVAGKKFFLSTTDPYNGIPANTLSSNNAVNQDQEIGEVGGVKYFATAASSAATPATGQKREFQVYNKDAVAVAGAAAVATALANVDVDAGTNEFRHTAQKTEGQANNVAGTGGVNDGDVVVGDLIKTDNGIRYFAATTAAQGAKFKIYTDTPVAPPGGLLNNDIRKATREVELTNLELDTAETRIHETKWANIIGDLTNTKDNLTFNRAVAGGANNDFQFTRELKQEDTLVGNDGQIYYAAADADAGANVTLKKDANDTTNGADPAGFATANAVAAADRAATLTLFQEGAIEKTNGAGTGNPGTGNGDHIIYKRSKVNTIRKSIKRVENFGREEKASKAGIRSFEGATNLKELKGRRAPSFNPNLKNAFKGAANLDTVDNINDWNTNNVTNMEGMFEDAAKFNLDVNFDTKNVTKMNNMFKGAKVFNKAVDFNTEKVTNMKSMFEGAVEFNRAINFNTKEVTDVDNMFDGATKFDQDLDDLDFRNVTTNEDIRKGTTAADVGNKKAPPAVRERKARLNGNDVALETGDKLFVEMDAGINSLGYVDNVFKSNFDDVNDGVYNGFTPGNDTFVSINAGAGAADKKTRATLTVGGVTATILGIEVRHTNSTTQPLIDANNLYVYLNKNLGNLGMTLRDGAGNAVVIAAVGPVIAPAAGAAGSAEEILARDGFAIDGGKFVKPAGFTVYKFAPAAVEKADFDAIMGTGHNGGVVAYAAGERSIVFNN